MHDSNIKVPNSACAFREGVLELPPEGSVRDFQPRSGAGHSVWGGEENSALTQGNRHVVHGTCQGGWQKREVLGRITKVLKHNIKVFGLYLKSGV